MRKLGKESKKIPLHRSKNLISCLRVKKMKTSFVLMGEQRQMLVVIAAITATILRRRGTKERESWTRRRVGTAPTEAAGKVTMTIAAARGRVQ